jgi:uncharacterized membrane protein YhaH (DUF805 family)
MHYYFDVLKKFAVFSGRARRKEYWTFALINLIIVSVFSGLIYYRSIASDLVIGIFGLYVVASVIPSIAVTVRRLHDINFSGWWFFISFVPYVGGFVLLVLTTFDSAPGDNKYGPNPKGLITK